MQSSTVFVTGGSGCVGSGVVRALVKHGHHVLALSRTERSAQFLRGLGAEPVPGNLNNLDWQSSVARSQAIVHCGMDWSADPGSDKHVLDWLLAQSSGKKFIYTGGAWLFGSGEFTEASKLDRGHGWDWLIDGVEAVLKAGHVTGMVVHPPQVYDFDRASGRCTGWLLRMVEEIRCTERVRLVESDMRRQAVGHTDDVGEVYALALGKGERGCSYNAGAITTTSGDMVAAAISVAGVKAVSVDILKLEIAREAFGASANGLNMDQVMHSPASIALGWAPQHTSLPTGFSE